MTILLFAVAALCLLPLLGITTPSSMIARLTGQEAFTDGILLGNGQTIGGPAGSNIVVVPPASTTLTLTAAAHGGRWLNIASTGGLTLTPPAATGTGITYRFFCSAPITGGSLTFDAKAGQASDLIYGSIRTVKTATTTYTQYTATGIIANTNLFTFDGSTMGGAAVGDWAEFTDLGLHLWLCTGGFTINSGTIATPFSNH